MECISGNKIKIVPLKLSHVYEMRDWGKYDSPLFKDYNFPNLSDVEVIRWFEMKNSEKNCKCFAIINDEDKTVGYINLKNINTIFKVATLGLSLDANYINKGYGTNALKILLEYYFKEMKMRTMYLDVAKHNERAIRCYEKCGFKKVKEYTLKVEDKDIEYMYEKDTEVSNNFCFKYGNLFGYYYRMKITKSMFNDNFSTSE